MRARRGFIPSSFLVLLLPLILVSCSGGGGTDTTTLSQSPASAPAPASLLWASDHSLVRSQTDGTGQVTLADDATFVKLVDSTVYYSTNGTLGQVQTNGTGQQAGPHFAEADGTFFRDLVGPWVIFDVLPLTFPKSSQLASVRFDGTDRSIIAPVIVQAGVTHQANYERSLDGRLIFEQINNLFSLLPDGTDRRQIATIPRGPNGEFTFGGTRGEVGSQVIYSVASPSFVPDLFAVPVTGGAVVTLANGPEYEFLGVVVGNRVVYHRCAVRLDPDLPLDQCDVYSVRSDGTGTVTLSTHPENEMVQGAIGSQVIIRRNSGATDALYSIQAGGGPEVPMLTLDAMTEFVSGIVGDRVILKRPTGLWSLHADGSGLVQLTTEDESFAVRAAGPFACFERGPALWCVPADGSTQATRVTETGTFVTEL